MHPFILWPHSKFLILSRPLIIGGGRERNDRDEYGDSEDNPYNTPPASSHQEEPMPGSTSLAANEPAKHFDTGPQLQKCSSSKSIENVQEECKGKPVD